MDFGKEAIEKIEALVMDSFTVEVGSRRRTLSRFQHLQGLSTLSKGMLMISI